MSFGCMWWFVHCIWISEFYFYYILYYIIYITNYITNYKRYSVSVYCVLNLDGFGVGGESWDLCIQPRIESLCDFLFLIWIFLMFLGLISLSDIDRRVCDHSWKGYIFYINYDYDLLQIPCWYLMYFSLVHVLCRLLQLNIFFVGKFFWIYIMQVNCIFNFWHIWKLFLYCQWENSTAGSEG